MTSTPPFALARRLRADETVFSSWCMTNSSVVAETIARFDGVSLAPDAIKLSARQVGDIPLPADRHGWERAARALEANDLLHAARLMTSAYAADDEVFDWWSRRLP